MSIIYTVKRSRKRQKTISLQVNVNSGLIVSAPYFTPAEEIDRFVREKQNWISKTLRKHTEDSIKNKAKEYNTGEHFFYLGQSYPLEVFFEPFENAGLVFWNDCFYLNAREDKDLRKHYFVSWYKKKSV